MDPAFYAPLPLQADAWLAARPSGSTVPLDSLVRVHTSAFYEGIADRYIATGTPLVRVADVQHGTLSSRRMTYLPPSVASTTPGLTTVPGPVILLTKGGSVGRVAISGPSEVALSRDIIGLTPNDQKLAGLLVLYLASAPGAAQILRGASRQVQAHLTVARLQSLEVPVVDSATARRLGAQLSAVVDARSAFDQARANVDSLFANDPFARLTSPPQSYELTRSENLRERLDPRFYRPGFSVAVDHAVGEGWTLLGAAPWVHFATGVWSRASAAPDATIHYVPLSAIEALSCRIVAPMTLRAWQVPSRAKWMLRAGDVLVPYLLGSLDRVGLATYRDNQSVASSGFYVLRTTSRAQARFLAAYLSSPGAQAQIVKAGTGAVMQSISDAQLKHLYLPPLRIQDEIAQAFATLQTAASNLSLTWKNAIAAVHMAIGWTGEATPPPDSTIDDDQGDSDDG